MDRNGTTGVTGDLLSGETSVTEPDLPEDGTLGEYAFAGAGGGGGGGVITSRFGGAVTMGDGVAPYSGEEVVTATPIFSADGVRDREGARSCRGIAPPCGSGSCFSCLSS
jgi:hypothetical protein